jgi:hypothetical protein
MLHNHKKTLIVIYYTKEMGFTNYIIDVVFSDFPYTVSHY